MFLELFSRLLSLDINWLVSLVMGNLLFVFGFAALMYYFMNGKNVFFATILLTLVLYAVHDFEAVAGFAIIAPGFLLFHYIGKLAVHILVEENPAMHKHHLLFTNIELITVFFLYNIFLR